MYVRFVQHRPASCFICQVSAYLPSPHHLLRPACLAESSTLLPAGVCRRGKWHARSNQKAPAEAAAKKAAERSVKTSQERPAHKKRRGCCRSGLCGRSLSQLHSQLLPIIERFETWETFSGTTRLPNVASFSDVYFVLGPSLNDGWIIAFNSFCFASLVWRELCHATVLHHPTLSAYPRVCRSHFTIIFMAFDDFVNPLGF